jgi:plasmid maintenance system antidote protein VapI
MSDSSKQLGLLIRKFYRNEGLTQKDFAKKIGYSRSYISEIVTGRRAISEDIKISFSNKFGFEIEELKKNGKESQINKSKERKKRVEGKLYDVEGLSQEKLDILQEMIDNWKGEEANKRKEERRKRAYKTKYKKSKSA